MRAVVVGGGVAGLTAALQLADQGVSVTVLEAAARFGGQLLTERGGGFLVEHGAEGFVARSSVVLAHCRRLGLGDEIVSQLTQRTLLSRDGWLRELALGEAARLLGIQADPEDFGKGLLALRGGMGALVDALVHCLTPRARLRPNVAATGVERHGSGWRVRCSDGPSLDADGLVLAVPPTQIESLLGLTIAVPHASLVSVTLAYQRDQVGHPLDASGVVAPLEDPDGFRAVTFSSSKFAGRAPSGWCLLRAIFSPSQATDDGDGCWVERAVAKVTPLLDLRGTPSRSWVARWPGAIPHYPPDHARAIDALRRHLTETGRIAVAGAAFERAGVDGAVRSGLEAADALLADAEGAVGAGGSPPLLAADTGGLPPAPTVLTR